MLGADLDARVQLYIKEMRKNGVVINTSMAAAEGIIMHHDTNLLAKNKGPIINIKHWAELFCQGCVLLNGKVTQKQKLVFLNLSS